MRLWLHAHLPTSEQPSVAVCRRRRPRSARPVAAGQGGPDACLRDMRWLKILGWVLGSILLLLVAAAGALWFGGAPVLAWLIEHPASTLIGRDIRLGGPLTVEWGSPTRIVLQDVH